MPDPPPHAMAQRQSTMQPISRATTSTVSSGGVISSGSAIGATSTFINPVPSGFVASPLDPNLRPEIKRENLGSKNIAGVYAEGNRVTTTFPIGFFGNDRPVATVSESWQSPDLKLVVLNIFEDPRSGRQTIEVTNIDRAEPDPSLFAPSQGYEIKEQPR
jgi:hypothetical protein